MFLCFLTLRRPPRIRRSACETACHQVTPLLCESHLINFNEIWCFVLIYHKIFFAQILVPRPIPKGHEKFVKNYYFFTFFPLQHSSTILNCSNYLDIIATFNKLHKSVSITEIYHYPWFPLVKILNRYIFSRSQRVAASRFIIFSQIKSKVRNLCHFSAIVWRKEAMGIINNYFLRVN